MKIIEIRQTEIGEVAYLLEKGKIYKVLVEDLTGAQPDDNAVLENPTRLRQRIKPVEMPTYDDGLTIDDIPDDLPIAPRREERPIPELGKAAPPKIKGPIPKGIPRNMVDIFKKPPELS